MSGVGVRISPDAIADIDDVAAFVARSSLSNAVAFLDLVYGRIDSLSIFPTRGKPCPRFGARMRSFPVRPVTIFYSIASDESEVLIQRVIVGGRDIEAIFRPVTGD